MSKFKRKYVVSFVILIVILCGVVVAVAHYGNKKTVSTTKTYLIANPVKLSISNIVSKGSCTAGVTVTNPFRLKLKATVTLWLPADIKVVSILDDGIAGTSSVTYQRQIDPGDGHVFGIDFRTTGNDDITFPPATLTFSDADGNSMPFVDTSSTQYRTARKESCPN